MNHSDIEHLAYQIYQDKCRRGIPEGEKNNAELNWKEAEARYKKKQEINELNKIWRGEIGK